jgi:hypothetical protein
LFGGGFDVVSPCIPPLAMFPVCDMPEFRCAGDGSGVSECGEVRAR